MVMSVEERERIDRGTERLLEDMRRAKDPRATLDHREPRPPGAGVMGGQGRDAEDMTWAARIVAIALAAAIVWVVVAWLLN